MSNLNTLCFVLVVLLCNLYSGFLHAQEVSDNAPYEKNKVLIKLKESYKDALTQQSTLNNPLHLLLKHITSHAPRQLFPNKQNNIAFRNNVKKSIGIDRIYEIITDIDPTIAKTILLKSNMLEYAELKYIDHVFQDTNDSLFVEQWYLPLIKATNAWDITKGNRNIIIGIVDTGMDFNHPDLLGNFHFNENDPIDGIDNDQDGYVDNYRGWDFAGSDFNNIQGDNYPQLITAGVDHGISVAGCAAAVTNNEKGVAGVAYNCTFISTKHTPDNDPNGGTGLFGTYEGIVYVAEMGAKIINCSWGGYVPTQYGLDVVSYVTNELGAVIVAAAGNDNKEDKIYPASYPDVFCVGASLGTEAKAAFSNFGYYLDVVAPGRSITTTVHSSTVGYNRVQGTSFSSPITAGGIALVMSKFPELSPIQAAELVRVTSDPVTYTANIPSFNDKLGQGRIDLFKAMENTRPSVRLTEYSLVNDSGSKVVAGDVGILKCDFINYLKPTSADFSIRISCLSSMVTFIENSDAAGVIQTMAHHTRSSGPFQFQLASSAPENLTLIFKVEYQQSDYTSFEYFEIIVNEPFVIIDKNKITTSADSKGTIGKHSSDRSKGKGWEYGNIDYLFEMGLMWGSSSSKLASATRSGASSFNNHFFSVESMHTTQSNETDTYFWEGSFNDKDASSKKSGVSCDQKIIAYDKAGKDTYITVEYSLTNTNSSDINNFYIGLFADWDVSANGQNDKVDFNPSLNLSYVYGSDVFCGIQLLSELPIQVMAINNDQNTSETPFGIYDGFTDEEKFLSLSSGTQHTKAGLGASGDDVSHVVGAGPINLKPGIPFKIAFAIHTNSSLSDLLTSASDAEDTYVEDETPSGIVESGEKIQLSIFPNPSSEVALLEWDSQYILEKVIVTDMSGKSYLVSYSNLTLGKSSVELSMLPIGSYILKLYTNKGIFSTKLIKN